MCEKTSVFILYLPKVTIVCEVHELFDSTCIKALKVCHILVHYVLSLRKWKCDQCKIKEIL